MAAVDYGDRNYFWVDAFDGDGRVVVEVGCFGVAIYWGVSDDGFYESFGVWFGGLFFFSVEFCDGSFCVGSSLRGVLTCA